MRATWRTMPAWPHPPRRKQSGTFPSGWERALDKLEAEVEQLKGDDLVIGLVLDPSWVSLSGSLKSGWQDGLKHQGVEVSFEVPGRGRLIFFTDAYKVVRYNVRAIALGLEALRAVDRYGITSAAEQYAGFAQLTAGGPDPLRGEKLVDRLGGIRKALAATHPDTRQPGFTDRDFADVQAYREASEGKLPAGAAT